jgi:hypothetical protein
VKGFACPHTTAGVLPIAEDLTLEGYHMGRLHALSFPPRVYNGYVRIYMPTHPSALFGGYVLEHRIVAEKALGHYLPAAAIVHHVDENGTNNRSDNLVICQNHAYHKLIHRRMRAFAACGHANWRHCRFCDQWFAPDDPSIVIRRNGKAQVEQVRHRPCDAKDKNVRMRRKKE